MMTTQYRTWDDKREIKVTYFKSNMRNMPYEACVSRTFRPSDELYLRLFKVNEGIVYRKGMTQGERNRWMHLYDGVCCESISPAEAYQCIEQGFVPEHLTVRASNYMHLI